MNIVLTSSSFSQSARALDNWRLKEQMLCLAYLSNNIIANSQSIRDLGEIRAVRYNMPLKAIDLSYMLTPKYKNDAATVWATANPMHSLLVFAYFDSTMTELGIRRQRGAIPSEVVDFVDAVFYKCYEALINTLHSQTGNTTQVFIPKQALYRKTDGNNEDIYEAYQEHLITRWKRDIFNYTEYEKELVKYNQGKLKVKPRQPRKLSWHKRSTSPIWAYKKLIEYKASLK